MTRPAQQVLDEVGEIARVTYQRHAADTGVCACTTCTIARILWPALGKREEERAAELSHPGSSVGTDPLGSDRAPATGDQQ